MLERIDVIKEVIRRMEELKPMLTDRTFVSVVSHHITSTIDFIEDNLEDDDFVGELVAIFVVTNTAENSEVPYCTAVNDIGEVIAQLRYELRLAEAEKRVIKKIREL